MANIVEIKRFAVHDGDGIRTTVFFKGCPLSCLWCHNPESIDYGHTLALFESKCTGCGDCATVCPHSVHRLEDRAHMLDRASCAGCGKCEEACLFDALTLYGRQMTVEELLPLLLADRPFYESSGGGVTLSGGECLMQADACAALLKELKREGIHTAVDTCGYVPFSAFEKVLPYTDVFLYDVKAITPGIHKKCTGKDNALILENLARLDNAGAKIEVRIPFVPGYNAVDLPRIAAHLRTIKHLCGVRLLPYHNMAGSKYAAIGRENTLPETPPDSALLARAHSLLRTFGLPLKE